VLIEYKQEGKKVVSVKLTNVPAFLYATDLAVECSGLGSIKVDVAYGGNFYAIVDPQENFQGLEHFTADQLISFSRECRTYLNKHYSFVHPENAHIKGLSHLLWTGKTISEKATARNAVFYGDKAIDRSPCGTGTSARMAQWYAKGLLKQGDVFVHESIIGSIFNGTIEGVTTVNNQPAIIPGIEGWARVTGYNTIIIDDDDPYAHGFQVI
jgi:4-hydroxyproline epimerase